MTNELLSKACVPCRGGLPALTHEQAEAALRRTPGWSLQDNAHRIERGYRFGNFKEAMDFVTALGVLSEAEGHHPDIGFGWGWATISWQTKKIGGLHENDFIMAAKTDRLAGE